MRGTTLKQLAARLLPPHEVHALDDWHGLGRGTIRFTTDRSVPTLSSPTYPGAFTLSSGTVTISFGAWDKVGNVETTHTQVVNVG